MKYLNFLAVLLLMILNYSCQKDVTTSPEEVLIPKYNLFVDSNPPGSKIFIDGRYMGQRTPDTIKWMETGNHLITLKTSLLKDTSVVVNISGEYSSIFFDYIANPTMRGSLYFDSNPTGAEIYLNDSATGLVTPTLLRNLFPAYYNVTYKLPGYWDWGKTTTVVSERTVTVSSSLIDSTVWVNFNMDNIGLPTDWYNDVSIQDGYIKWFATEGSGLIKFISGSDFTVYNTGNSSIPSNNVKTVSAAENGVWVGTNNGAAFFNGSNFNVYNSFNSPLSDSITCILPLTGGKVWFGTKASGAFYFDGTSWINYNKNNSYIRSNKINCIESKDGIIWIGTLDQGLILFDGAGWLKIYNALPSPNVTAIELSDPDIWIGTSFFKLVYWNGLTWLEKIFNGGIACRTNVWTKYKQAGANITALKKDALGNLWFADFLTGLGKLTNGSIVRYTGYNKINGIAIDGSGHKWMSTAERGIVKYKGN